MKKLPILLLLVTALTACGPTAEPIVVQPSPDGIEVDHAEVFGRLTFIDENSVSFDTSLEDTAQGYGENTYTLSKDAVIKVMEGGQLVELPRERAMEISLSSNSNDYLFYFVVSSDEVLSMTQAVTLAEDFDMATDDLVYVTNVYQKDGKDFITVDPIHFLTEPDCTNDPAKISAGQLACNPNGFLIQNSEVESVDYEVPTDKTVFSVIQWGVSTASAYPMSFADFQKKFTDEKENFSVIPYHLKTDGEQVVSLTEKYIP